MKKLLYIGLLALGFSSCSDFLDINDEEVVSTDDLFSTISGVEEALDGTYYEFSNPSYYNRNMIITPEIKGGNLKINDLDFQNPRSYNNIHSMEFTHLVSGEDDYTDEAYKQIYKLISDANRIIDNIDRVQDATEEQKTQAVAEARAIRALAHFDLTRLYAQPYGYTQNAQHLGVPYMLKGIDWDQLVARDLLYDNYEDMITDLTFAEENLGTPLGIEGAHYAKAYMSKLAAQALLARIYLYKGDWDNAREYATKVIEDGSVSLLDNSQVLASYEQQEATSEDIFIIDNSGKSIAAPLSEAMGISDGRTSLYMIPTNDIKSLYAEGDVRGELFEEQKDVLLTKKWKEFADQDNHIRVVRLAEMYLIRAEAALNQPQRDEVQARADLDVIRKRANPNAENLQLFGDELREELFQERRRELAFEGHLFFDIARMGRNLRREDCNARVNKDIDYPSDLYALPIPKDAMEYNEYMVQNSGY